MRLRPYQPGDEDAQVQIYNIAAGSLPAFKRANVEEVARRYKSADFDPASKWYAERDGRVVGYAVFNPNGRVSYPWCLPDAEDLREPLLDAVLSGLRERGIPEAWAAYRADWPAVLSFLESRGFERSRTMVNYAAELARVPRIPVPPGESIEPLDRADVPHLVALGEGLFPGDVESLARSFWENPYLAPSDLFALRGRDGKIRGIALLVGNRGFADPTKVDPAMPCFRLGTFGTEQERHKRLNGVFSCLFEDEAAGEILLGEAARRLELSGLTHIASQVPSDAPAQCAFYDRQFQRQGSFPILRRATGA
jgi:hypothetical protein